MMSSVFTDGFSEPEASMDSKEPFEGKVAISSCHANKKRLKGTDRKCT